MQKIELLYHYMITAGFISFNSVFFKLSKLSGGSWGQRQFSEEDYRYEQLAGKHKKLGDEHPELVKKKKRILGDVGGNQ